MTLVHTLQAALAGTGIDLLQPFAAQAYNAAIAGHTRLEALETFGRAATPAVLVGNTRALWSPLLAAWRADAQLRQSTDPVDDYVAARLARAAAAVSIRHALYLGREQTTSLSLLHAAQASGLARVGPAHLAVHPELGPWFGLRAVLVFDAPHEPAARMASSPCEGCPRPCEPKLTQALADYAAHGGGTSASSWRSWLAVRDACPVGREHRYDEAQLRYHYTKDLSGLVTSAKALFRPACDQDVRDPDAHS